MTKYEQGREFEGGKRVGCKKAHGSNEMYGNNKENHFDDPLNTVRHSIFGTQDL